jgi:ribosomal protein S18 acetylase RimI-like enzyme
MDIKVRTLAAGDYPDILALWKSAGLTSLREKGRDGKESVTVQMERDPDLFIGAFIDGKLVGVCVGSDDGRKGWINRLTVHPDFRRRGIAKQLLAETERALKKRGRKIICADIEEWNVDSLALFQKEKYVLHKDILYLSKRESEDV